MLRQKLIITFTFFLLAMPLFAQDNDTTAVESTSSKPKFLFAFDARNSFMLGQNSKLSGVKLGLEFHEKYRVGIGFYNLAKPIFMPSSTHEGKTAKVDFGYNALYFEYIFFQNKHWEFTVPFHFGGGKAFISTFDSIGVPSLDENGLLIPVKEIGFSAAELSIAGQYKIFPWVGIGTGLGYRWVLSHEKNTRKAFQAPVYIIKLKVFIGVLYRNVFPKKEDRKKKSTAKDE